MDDVFGNGPRMIRNVPIILNERTLDTSLLKEDPTRVHVWVKLHDVPMAKADGLSLIVTKLGTPMMLDSFTSTMFEESCGRSSFVRALIEINFEDELKDSLILAIQLHNGSGYSK